MAGRRRFSLTRVLRGIISALGRAARPPRRRTEGPRRRKRCPVCGSALVFKRFSRWQPGDRLEPGHDEAVLGGFVVRDRRGDRVHMLGVAATCLRCKRCTVEDPFVPDNEASPAAVGPYRLGWVRCPDCGWRFSLADHGQWDGRRHRRCGRVLLVGEPPPPPSEPLVGGTGGS